MNHFKLAAVGVALAVAAAGDLVGRRDTAYAQRAGDPGVAQTRHIRRAVNRIPNEYIVVLAPDQDAQVVGPEAARLHSARLRGVYRAALNGFSIQMSEAAAERLANDPRVLFVEEDRVIAVEQTSATWGQDRIDQRALPLDGIANLGAAGAAATGLGVDVHVVDSGIRLTHQEFGGRAFSVGDFVDDDADPSTDAANDDGDPALPDGDDCHGHGTHVAGTVGGATYGVAKNVRLYSYRVLACGGVGSVANLLAALDALALQSYRPAVANLSLAAEAGDAIDAATRTVIESGIVVVVAAGNGNDNAEIYSPSRVEEAITVGATGPNDARATFSNFGTVLDLFAPGTSIVSGWITSNTATKSLSGTSMATPHVAGAAALYLELNPLSTPQDTRDALVAAATRNVIPSPGAGSPNLLLYAGAVADSPPQVTLSTPNAGAKVFTATPYTIEWTADDADGIDALDVWLSVDAGATYSPLAGCTNLAGSARSCVWATPGPATTKARIKVIAYDGAGTPGQDASDGSFSIISGAASVVVSAPNTAVKWVRGSLQEIKWTQNVGAHAYMRVELSRDGGATFPEVLAPSVKNTSSSGGSFFWPVTGPSTATARVRVSWNNGPVSDVSNVAFEIIEPTINVTSPNSTSVNWGYGTTQWVKWTHNLGSAARFDIHMSTDGGVTFPLVLATAVSGTQVHVSVPTLAAPTTMARIRVVCSGIAAADVNAANFRVEPPFVTVVKPNGGETWTVGTTPNVTWTSNLGSLESVRVELSTDGGASYPTVVHSTTPSDGKQSVAVNSAWVSTAAKIRVVWIDSASVNDASNATFVIQ